MELPDVARTVLTVLLQLCSAVWLGGYVAIAVVAFVSRETLDAAVRVRFFRLLGRAFLPIGGAALGGGLISGGLLLAERPWDARSATAVVLAAALLITLVVAVRQARRMTRLRQAAFSSGGQAEAVRHGAAAAAALRALLGLLSVALIVAGSLLGS